MINLWQGKRILVIGAARQGLAAARYLAGKKAHVVLNDSRPEKVFSREIADLEKFEIEFHFGDHSLSLLDNLDAVCISGGVPLSLPIIQEAKEKNIVLTNDSQIFLQGCSAKVIGITGSAGKTTTTVLLGEIAKAARKPDQNIWVGGNIGDPLINYLDQIQSSDWVIMEISSFQLEQMDISPSIALILNITPNHLDRHGSMEAYKNAKARIIQFQTSQDVCILNRDDSGSKFLFDLARGRIMTFGKEQPIKYEGVFVNDNQVFFSDGIRELFLATRNNLKLIGDHNFLNMMAACAAAVAAGFSQRAIQAGISSVTDIPHRLEFVKENNGIRWVNDSIATTPERVVAAIKALDQPLVLLLGGRDKNLPWRGLAEILHEKKPKVVLFGEASKLIESELLGYEKGQRSYPLAIEESFEDAVMKAAELAISGECVLLSPGGTSYDAYRDFEERGDHFRSLVEELA